MLTVFRLLIVSLSTGLVLAGCSAPSSSNDEVQSAVAPQQEVSTTHSSFVADVTELVANGTARTTLRVQLRDSERDAIKVGGHQVTFSQPQHGVLGDVTDHGDGTYTATYTVGNAPARESVTATVDGEQISSVVSIDLQPVEASASQSVFSSGVTTLTANASETTTLTLQIKNKNGDNITYGGYNVTFGSPQHGSIGQVTDNGDGTFVATYTAGSQPATVNLTATIEGEPVDSGITLTLDNAFQLADNGVTILCPKASNLAVGSVGGVTYTKRNRQQIDTLISNDEWHQLPSTCTTGITDLSYTFIGETAFNEDIRRWDTSQVTTMEFLFHGAENFNQPIGHWDTSNVTTMSNMFVSAKNFDQDIGSWVTSDVFDMTRMFVNAASFNKDIAGWDTGAIESTRMMGMFAGASSFDQDISGWKPGCSVYENVIGDPGEFFDASKVAAGWTASERPTWDAPC